MKANKGKVTKTERMEVLTSTYKNIELIVDVKSVGLAPFDDEQPIHVSLGASGSVIVHECDNVFMRSDNIESIITEVVNGTEFTTIKFKH